MPLPAIMHFIVSKLIAHNALDFVYFRNMKAVSSAIPCPVPARIKPEAVGVSGQNVYND
jgi:hypothetical protein